MLGAMVGDIVGSVYEFATIKTKDFPLFDERSAYTDDSVMTAAVFDTLTQDGITLDTAAPVRPPLVWNDHLLTRRFR